ncbi:hypothetical protein MSG28_004397 [Choristoneura fumiferana]|uniref:Uncharacterized protein n=1 Tax=Choristoneura fumiferana TaxID=7141 RepID=A0ACC0KJS3_CHOFU|nr:hypothetical protein MSG28_004397 [Choristoneura fumiferana]
MLAKYPDIQQKPVATPRPGVRYDRQDSPDYLTLNTQIEEASKVVAGAMLAGYRRAGHRSVAPALRARPCWNNTSRALARRLTVTVYEVACLCGALRAAAGLLRAAPARTWSGAREAWSAARTRVALAGALAFALLRRARARHASR